jgi:hypothetical protein
MTTGRPNNDRLILIKLIMAVILAIIGTLIISTAAFSAPDYNFTIPPANGEFVEYSSVFDNPPKDYYYPTTRPLPDYTIKIKVKEGDTSPIWADDSFQGYKVAKYWISDKQEKLLPRHKQKAWKARWQLYLRDRAGWNKSRLNERRRQLQYQHEEQGQWMTELVELPKDIYGPPALIRKRVLWEKDFPYWVDTPIQD